MLLKLLILTVVLVDSDSKLVQIYVFVFMVYLIMAGSHHFKDEIHVETLDQFDNINVDI